MLPMAVPGLVLGATYRPVAKNMEIGGDWYDVIALDEAGVPSGQIFELATENDLGEFRLHVPGVHNGLNATAAIAVGTGLDIKADDIRSALENFRGVDRRFQLRGKAAAGGGRRAAASPRSRQPSVPRRS